ncbi:hypothetical protein D3C84_322130 [compost metagenome]
MIERLASRTLIGGPRSPPGTALAIQQHHHHQQQQAGQLRRARQAEEAVPGLVDRRGEGVEVEHRYRTEVRQRLHQGQGHARADGRARHGQGHVPERLPRRLAQHPRRLHQALALGQERRARQQVDIGIEHQHQHQDHATGGAHPWQSQATAQPFPQQGLHRSGKIQQADEDERQHVGRDRKRQHQRPIQPAASGELAQTGQPRQAHTQQRDTHADAEDQGQGVAQQPWHLGVPQVGPDLQVDGLPRQQQHTQR